MSPNAPAAEAAGMRVAFEYGAKRPNASRAEMMRAAEHLPCAPIIQAKGGDFARGLQNGLMIVAQSRE